MCPATLIADSSFTLPARAPFEINCALIQIFLGIEHRRLQANRAPDLVKLTNTQFTGSQNFYAPITQYSSQKGLFEFDVIDLLQGGVGDLFIEDAGNLNDSPVCDDVLAVLPDEQVAQQTDCW